MANMRKNYRSEVLGFVESFMEDNGYPPTLDEIKESVGLSSKSHVDYYLVALEEDGLIERTPRTPRGLRLVGLSRSTFAVDVEGTIAAGQPLELADSPRQEIELTSDIADPRKDLFALQVQGDSMVDDLVGDGDILVVERRQEAAQGQMAIVYLQDRNEATLKRIYREGRRVRLQPAHPTLQPLYADAKDVQVQGRVVALIRRT
ncbi:transcriptional repressor LexA [Chloroflexota bacterium]